jgi:hypothetical protein
VLSTPPFLFGFLTFSRQIFCQPVTAPIRFQHKFENMKMLLCGLTLLFSIFGCTGCGPALHPFFTSSDLYEDPALEGRWVQGEQMWEIVRVGDGRYTLAECDPECKDAVPATLFRLGGQVYLDFQEKREGGLSSAIYPHGILKLRVANDQVEVNGLDEDALRSGLEQKRIGLQHVSIDGTKLLVTSPTAKLQQFLVRYSYDPQVWSETLVFRRAELVTQGSSRWESEVSSPKRLLCRKSAVALGL